MWAKEVGGLPPLGSTKSAISRHLVICPHLSTPSGSQNIRVQPLADSPCQWQQDRAPQTSVWTPACPVTTEASNITDKIYSMRHLAPGTRRAELNLEQAGRCSLGAHLQKLWQLLGSALFLDGLNCPLSEQATLEGSSALSSQSAETLRTENTGS